MNYGLLIMNYLLSLQHHYVTKDNFMKKFLFFAFLMATTQTAMAEQVTIQTKNTTMVLNVDQGKQPQYVYYGARLSDADLQHLQESAASGRMDAYPAYGMNCPAEAALAMTHADGNLSTELLATGSVTHEGMITRILMKDPVYPITVALCYMPRVEEDIIETWTEIQNGEAKPVTLTQFASICLPIRRGDVWLSHFYGSWANEAQLVEEPILPGEKVIKNKDGTRNSHTDHAEVMFSLDGKGRENCGDVIGAALCYSGNFQLKIDTDDTEFHYFFAGINPDNSEYHLKKGEYFVTPKVALSFSKQGLSGVSRNFHKWGRKYMLAHGDKERKILLNSWEGVYFDINQQGMDQMMGDIASMGGELFVMDDGWFGDKYPRKTDNSSLGDWVVDKNKLPEGIEGLLRDAKKHGIKFGIWIEPVVLDLSNPKVQDFVFSIVDDLMTKYPEIDYIKWDANMPILNHGSQYLTMNDQSHLYIEYHRGFEKACQRIRDKYPDLTIQACASGGGRANWGVLPYFDEFWVSDNTDALQRIYMQWGTSYFFPAIAMASHISATPNHTVFRTTAMKYRIDVAMSGRLGMEIQPKNMTDDEKALCRNAIQEYKGIRPIVQFGDLYRLVSPYDKKGLASLMYVDEAKTKSVFFWWKTESFQNEHLPRVKMAGLDANKMYKIHELNRIDLKPLDIEGKAFSGAYLMNHGLEVPYRNETEWSKKNDWSSRVLPALMGERRKLKRSQPL